GSVQMKPDMKQTMRDQFPASPIPTPVPVPPINNNPWIGESRILSVLVSLGVPGVALGILYLLFRSFHWEFAQVPETWVAPIVILFMLIVGGIVFYALTLWRPNDRAAEEAEKRHAQKRQLKDRARLV